MAQKQKPKGNRGIILVKKANQLIESRYKFDIWETRFFLAVLGQVRREDDEFKVYRVWYRDVIKAFGLKSGDSYAFLRAAANSLMEKSFFVSYESEGMAREVRYHILRKIDYLKEGQESRGGGESQEFVDVTVEEEMKPLLLQLQKNFTAYDLRNVVKLGVYPMRIYELLKQYESIGSRTLGVEEIKKMFELTTEYARFPDFNRWVIKPAVRDINKHTDLEISALEYIKEGRGVAALRFVFHKKNRDVALPPLAEKEASTPPIFFPTTAGTAEVAEPNLNEYAERLFDWWGIQPEAFLKRAEGKSAQDVEAAIEFTKTRIRAGKAENPAGVFLEALSKGHVTTDQHKARKKADRDQKEREKQTQLRPLLEAVSVLQDEYAKAINDAIRAITHENPEVTDLVVGRIRSNFKHMGVADMDDKTVEDFRQSPMLRALVKAEIMKDFPERFAGLNADFGQRLSAVKAQVLAIEPGFRFE